MNNRVLIICITVLAIFAIGGGIFIANRPDGGTQTAGAIGLIVTALAPLISTLVLLSRQAGVKTTLESTQDNTEKMLNGVMDAKLEAAFHKVLTKAGIIQATPPPPGGESGGPVS